MTLYALKTVWDCSVWRCVAVTLDTHWIEIMSPVRVRSYYQVHVHIWFIHCWRDCICTVRIHLAAWLNLYEDSLLSQVYRHNNNLFVCTNNMHACINICCCCFITQILTSVQSHHVIKSAVTLMEGSSVSVRKDMCWTRMRGAVWVAMCCSCVTGHKYVLRNSHAYAMPIPCF